MLPLDERFAKSARSRPDARQPDASLGVADVTADVTPCSASRTDERV